MAEPHLAASVCHYTGLAPIHWAVKHNNRRLVDLLLTHLGVAVDQVSRAGHTPLHLAAIYGRRELYSDLLSKYKAGPAIRDFSGKVRPGQGGGCRWPPGWWTWSSAMAPIVAG